MQKKESPIKDEIYPEVQLEKRDLHQNETTINSSVTANNPSQNISDPSPQKQLRTHINSAPKSANDDLIEPQPEETNPGSSDNDSDSNYCFETILTRKKTSKIFTKLRVMVQ